MGTKFIHNTDDATIICKVATEAERIAGQEKTFVLRNKKIDRDNNTIISNGYTEVTEEELALLEAESSTYKYYASIGRLTVVDSLPLESMTPEQMSMALKSENAKLKKDLAKALAATGENQQAEIDALNGHVAEQLKEIEELSEQLAAKQKELDDSQMIIDELTIQLSEETIIPDEDDVTKAKDE